MTNEERSLFKAMTGNMDDEQIIQLVTIVAETGAEQVMSFQLWKALKTWCEQYVTDYHDQYSLVAEIDGVKGKLEVFMLEVVKDED